METPVSRTRSAAAAKTDNEKYVKRGADLFIEYDPEWEDGVGGANEGKVALYNKWRDESIAREAEVAHHGHMTPRLRPEEARPACMGELGNILPFCQTTNRKLAESYHDVPS